MPIVMFTIGIGLVAPMVGCSRPSSPGASTSSTPQRVHRVIDGDTIEISFGEAVETVRLLGIDTPETVHPTKPIECFGPEASSSLKVLLPVGTPVRLERDRELHDHFGRILAYVYRLDDDRFVNLIQLQQGDAEVSIIEPNDAFASEFRAAEMRARVDHLGMWAACR